MCDNVSIRVSGSGPVFVPTPKPWNVFTDEQLTQRDRETAARALMPIVALVDRWEREHSERWPNDSLYMEGVVLLLRDAIKRAIVAGGSDADE